MHTGLLAARHVLGADVAVSRRARATSAPAPRGASPGWRRARRSTRSAMLGGRPVGVAADLRRRPAGAAPRRLPPQPDRVRPGGAGPAPTCRCPDGPAGRRSRAGRRGAGAAGARGTAWSRSRRDGLGEALRGQPGPAVHDGPRPRRGPRLLPGRRRGRPARRHRCCLPVGLRGPSWISRSHPRERHRGAAVPPPPRGGSSRSRGRLTSVPLTTAVPAAFTASPRGPGRPRSRIRRRALAGRNADGGPRLQRGDRVPRLCRSTLAPTRPSCRVSPDADASSAGGPASRAAGFTVRDVSTSHRRAATGGDEVTGRPRGGRVAGPARCAPTRSSCSPSRTADRLRACRPRRLACPQTRCRHRTVMQPVCRRSRSAPPSRSAAGASKPPAGLLHRTRRVLGRMRVAAAAAGWL